MKKIKIAIIAIGMLGLSACGNDDEEVITNCETCTFMVVDQELITEYCDNGDGTVTATTAGVEQTEDLEDVTFDEFIAALELLGSTCN